MLKEVRFSYQHPDCWLIESSQRHPSLGLVLSSFSWVDEVVHVDVTAYAQDPATVGAVASEWRADPRIRNVTQLYEGARGTRFRVTYARDHSLYPLIVQQTLLSLGTVTVTGGTEYYTLLGEPAEVEGLLSLLNQHGTTRVQSVRGGAEPLDAKQPDFTTSLAHVLTQKQLEALVLAHTQGYYNWPRFQSASELAVRVGLSSAAFLDHLRRAESKALTAVLDNLMTTDPERIQALRSRFTASAPAKPIGLASGAALAPPRA